jgi:hypothetical protein
MKRLIPLFCFLFCGIALAGQNNQMTQSTRDAFNYGQMGNFNPNSSASMVYGIADAPGEVVGDIYLDSSYLKSSVVFYRDIVKRYDANASDSIAGYKIRIDLHSSIVEFKFGDAIKGIDPLAIRRIHYQRIGEDKMSNFWNIKEFNDVPDEVTALLEMLGEGRLKIGKSYSLLYIKPTYNAALSVGDKNGRYIKRVSYYYADAKNNLIKFKPKRKELLALMADKAEQVLKYMNSKGNSLSTDQEIRSVLAYYNSLVDL